MTDKPVIGWREWVSLPDLGVEWVKAKIDTGAKSSSIHAWDIDVDDRAGEVRFNLCPRQDDESFVVAARALLVEHREVRSSNGEVDLRPVIRTAAVVRGHAFDIELSLASRDEMGFRMLLGRSAIRRRFLVDAGKSFVGGGNRFTLPS
ncbi:MAG TPA: RimK/LysX family protein [Jatrophihabitantaceae bacterium]|nr:RimK/LysX family protein [Jatrophihabitantaceae bacterium]